MPCGNVTVEGLVNIGAVSAAVRPAHTIETTAVRRAMALRVNRNVREEALLWGQRVNRDVAWVDLAGFE